MIDHAHAFHRATRPRVPGRGALLPLAAIAILLAMLLAAGCGGAGEPPDDEPDPGPVSGVEIVNLTRTWWYAHRANNAMRYTDTLGSPHHRAGFGVVNDPPYKFAYAPGGFLPPGRGPDSEGEVYSTYDGTVYGVRLDSPWASADNNYAIETRAIYEQRQYFQKSGGRGAPAAEGVGGADRGRQRQHPLQHGLHTGGRRRLRRQPGGQGVLRR